MRTSKSKVGIVAVLLYLLCLFVALRFVFLNPLDKFKGFFLVPLTFPWSFLVGTVSVVLELIGIESTVSDTTNAWILALGAIPNCYLIYRICKIGEKLFWKKNA